MAEVSSIETRGDLVIDSRVANEGDGWVGSGASPWHLDEETESILFLTNLGEEECPIGFRMQANGVTYYLTDLALAPRETRAIDIRKLRDAQKPDLFDTKLPASATDGSVTWIRIGAKPLMGRLVVLRKKAGIASNYDCDLCCCGAWPTGAGSVSPTSVNKSVGQTQQFTFSAGYSDCYGGFCYYNVTNSSTWGGGPSGVATVSNTSPTKGRATAVGPGTATVSASYHERKYECQSWIGQCVDAGYDVWAYGGATLNVGDATPVITSITPSAWPAGQTRLVTINGSGFGSNPLVTISDPTVTKTIVTKNNTQITMNVTVPASNPGTTATVTVTSQGLNGTGFIAVPSGGSQPNSAPYQVIEYTVQIVNSDASRNFVFVGTSDPTVVNYNTQWAAGSPSSGKYSWSVSPEAVTINPNNSTNA
jgi:hypothetical protein